MERRELPAQCKRAGDVGWIGWGTVIELDDHGDRVGAHLGKLGLEQIGTLAGLCGRRELRDVAVGELEIEDR